MAKPQIGRRGRGRPPMKATRSRLPNVTAADVVEMVKYRSQGLTMQEIGKKVRRSKCVVIKYVNGGKIVRAGRKPLLTVRQKKGEQRP